MARSGGTLLHAAGHETSAVVAHYNERRNFDVNRKEACSVLHYCRFWEVQCCMVICKGVGVDRCRER
jgi:hypothetical protein